ncbi:MAG: N-6 DNA methylase [Desulfovibrio sp.]|nr:N-6 DNA methylase [Desulfovibrio sp.]
MSYDGIFDNHLYDRNFFENEILETLPEIADPDAVFERLEQIRKKVVTGDSEANLDLSFTSALLDELDWPHAYQQKFKFHGNKKIPDFFLFASGQDKHTFLASPTDNKPLKTIFSIWEDKAENVKLDNGKTDNSNPYFQLMDYLVYLRLPFGFLSNGHEIWYVDNSDIFSEKRYLAMDFDRLVQSRNVNALRIFLGIYGHAGHMAAGDKEAPAAQVARESMRRKTQSEEELRNVIYGLNGRDSLFEKCGVFLFKAQEKQDPSILTELYKNCLYFTFRLLFIAFFEDRHRNILLKHSGYQSVSLLSLFQHTKELVEKGDTDGYQSWNALQTLFRTLDEGNPNLDIPLFNGGLFARRVAAMLDRPKVMTNLEVHELLDMLYGESATGYIRDFSSLSVIQLGRIYESLLEFEFRIAEENLWYFAYKEKKKAKTETIEGYFDTEDYRKIEKKYTITSDVVGYKKGEVYLVGGKNSRKQSASYYTPQSLSRPLVKAALDDAVDKLGEAESLLDLKILDNACGSGHMLVESLQYLTQLAIARIEDDPKLMPILEDEKKRINEALDELGLLKMGIEVDELSILKRILLKRILYGVDAQPFAVELTKLSLWIETFVFGTPLSFIEHHVKAGNSLMGCTMSRVSERLNTGRGNLLALTIKQSFRALGDVFQKLNDLQDTTAADITTSKNIYQAEILPQLEEMNKYFDLMNAADMLLAESGADGKMATETPPTGISPNEKWKDTYRQRAAEKKKKALLQLKKYEELAQGLHDQAEGSEKTVSFIQGMREKYRFFNWHLEFPEVFASPEAKGFDVIIGNPPWDKTKFSDPDFFSQYRSNYRQMSNSEKRRTATELLAKPFIRERYEKEENGILAANEYYKEHFPRSQGEGDGNLFRFFVEKNLGLLRKGGTLNYVIPTALWTDEGSTALRKHIFDKFWLRSFYGFENREKLFPDIDIRYKYGLMQIEKPRGDMPASEKVATARFMLTSPTELEDKSKTFAYTMDDVSITSPRWHALMEVRSRAELDILRKIHGSGYAYLDPAWIDFRRELDATDDKKIFHEHRAEGMIPLYKGACIWQFNSQYWNQAGAENRNEYWLDVEEFDRHLLSKERKRIIADLYPQLPRAGKKSKIKAVLDALGLKNAAELDQFIVPDRHFPRLAFRAIASDTNERSMVAAVIPANVGAQNSLWVSIPKRYALDGKKVTVRPQDLETLFFTQSFFNSLVFDRVIRCSITINVNKTYILRMPMPQPTAAEITAHPDFLRLARNGLRLSAYYNKEAFGPLFSQLGLDASDRITTEKQAAMARRENDLIIIRLYGLNTTDMEVILGSFAGMNNNRPGYAEALLEMLAATTAPADSGA